MGWGGVGGDPLHPWAEGQRGGSEAARPGERAGAMEEGLQDDGPSGRQPLWNWGEARRERGFGGWGGRNPRAPGSPLPPVFGWCPQRVWVTRFTEINLLRYTAGQRKQMVQWSVVVGDQWRISPHICLPPTLPQADPSAGGQDHPREHIPRPSGFPPERGSQGLCTTEQSAITLYYTSSFPCHVSLLSPAGPWPS